MLQAASRVRVLGFSTPRANKRPKGSISGKEGMHANPNVADYCYGAVLASVRNMTTEPAKAASVVIVTTGTRYSCRPAATHM